MEISFKKCTIGDNISLSAMKTERFKTSVLKLSIAMPATVDERDTALFALMINVLKCGTQKYPEKSDIIKRLGDLYDASCYVGGYALGDNRILEISSEMLSDRFSDEESILGGVTELIDQLLYHPAVDEKGFFLSENVNIQKSVICDKIKSEKNNSRSYAFKRCREIMCAGEPYGCAVKTDAILKITPEELTDYYKSFIARSELSFSYIGDEDIAKVAEIIEKYFKNEPIGKSVPILPLSCRTSAEVKRCEEELEIKQGILIMGFRSGILLGDRLSDAMRVFNNIFGGTSTSRLFTVVREKMGLCYYCDTDYVNTKGLLFVSSGISVDKRETVEGEILRQLDKLKNEPINEDELDSAKDMAVKELKEMCDYQSSVAAFKSAMEIYGFDCDVEKIISRLRSVTAEDLLEIAQKITLDTVFFLKGNAQDEEADGDE